MFLLNSKKQKNTSQPIEAAQAWWPGPVPPPQPGTGQLRAPSTPQGWEWAETWAHMWSHLLRPISRLGWAVRSRSPALLGQGLKTTRWRGRLGLEVEGGWAEAVRPGHVLRAITQFLIFFVLRYITQIECWGAKFPPFYPVAFINIISGFCLKKYIANIHIGNDKPKMPNRAKTTGVQKYFWFSRDTVREVIVQDTSLFT